MLPADRTGRGTQIYVLKHARGIMKPEAHHVHQSTRETLQDLSPHLDACCGNLDALLGSLSRPQSERFEQDDLTPLMYAVFGGCSASQGLINWRCPFLDCLCDKNIAYYKDASES